MQLIHRRKKEGKNEKRGLQFENLEKTREHGGLLPGNPRTFKLKWKRNEESFFNLIQFIT